MHRAQTYAFPAGESSTSKRQSTKYEESNNVVDEYAPGRMYDTRPSWKLFLWNPQTKEFLCRNATSWAKIISFYVVFYLFLAGFFAAMMTVLYNTLSNDRPKYTAKGGQSLLSSPGLSIRPDLHHTITYNRSDKYTYDPFVASIDEFIGRYNETREQNKDRYAQCDDGRVQGKVCDFDVSQLTRQYRPNWGYDTASPTVILKLNKVFDWEPEVLDKNSDKLPEDLREYIRDYTTNMTWLWCTASKENAVTLGYSPQPGFPVVYYPFYNQQGYLPPLVAVSVTNLPVGREVQVTCRAYAENIKNPSIQFTFHVHGKIQEA